MNEKSASLISLFDGWNGYQSSLVSAIVPLTSDQLNYRPQPHMRSIGEIAAHIAFGRLDWFHRMGALEAAELVKAASDVWQPWSDVDARVTTSQVEIVMWLNTTWNMIESNLKNWTVDDLSWSYQQSYGGKVYAVSRQWVIFRILAHDIHHGGQLSILLSELGIETHDLGDNGGHIVQPPLVC